MEIKIGIGIRSNEPQLIKEANELFKSGILDFVELFIIPETEVTPFKKLEMPLTIHAPHDGYGVNLADPKKLDFSVKCVNQALSAADKLEADYVVCHPGFINENFDYSVAMESLITALSYFKSKRICVENLPYKGIFNSSICMCYSPEDIKKVLLKLAKKSIGFCLDLNHAYKAAISLKKSPIALIDEFKDLKPAYFHLSDGSISVEHDEHLALGQGNYDLRLIKNFIQDSKTRMVVIETRRQSKMSLEENIKDINFLRDL